MYQVEGYAFETKEQEAVSCIPNTRNNLIVTVRIKLLTESIIKKVMIYCFFLYIITSFYFLMLFLDAAHTVR